MAFGDHVPQNSRMDERALALWIAYETVIGYTVHTTMGTHERAVEAIRQIQELRDKLVGPPKGIKAQKDKISLSDLQKKKK